LSSIKRDSSVFKSLLNQNNKKQIESDKSLLINYAPDRKKIDLVLSTSCIYCIEMFREMINLLALSEEYYLSIKIINKSDAITTEYWFQNMIKGLHTDVQELLEFSILENEELHNIGNLDNLLASANVNDFNELVRNPVEVDLYPTVFLNSIVLPRIYSPKELKSHLVMSTYS